MEDLRKELKQLSFELDIIQQEYCLKEEEEELRKAKKNKLDLPLGIMTDSAGIHYRYVKTDLSKDQIKELISYRQTKYLKTIKNSMLFFVVLSIISMVLAFVSLCNLNM